MTWARWCTCLHSPRLSCTLLTKWLCRGAIPSHSTVGSPCRPHHRSLSSSTLPLPPPHPPSALPAQRSSLRPLPVGSCADVPSFTHSLHFLHSQGLLSQAVSLFTSHPHLHTVNLTIQLLHDLSSSPTPPAHPALPPSIFSSLLSHLHRHDLLPHHSLISLFYHTLTHADLYASHHIYNLFTLSSLIHPPSPDSSRYPPNPSSSSSPVASPSPSPPPRLTVVAFASLLQSYTIHRMKAVTAHGPTAVHVHTSISASTFPLFGLAPPPPPSPPHSPLVRPPWHPSAVFPHHAHETFPLVPVEGKWHPLLLACHARAMQRREVGSVAAFPFAFLAPEIMRGEGEEVEGGLDVRDSLIIAEYVQVISYALPVRALRRAVVPLLHGLLYHVAFLAALAPSPAPVLVDAALSLTGKLEELNAYSSVVPLNLVLSAWASLLSLQPTPAPHLRYGALVGFYERAKASEMRHAVPSSDTLPSLVLAASSCTRDADVGQASEWVEPLVSERHQLTMPRPALLIIAQPCKYLDLVREHRDRCRRHPPAPPPSAEAVAEAEAVLREYRQTLDATTSSFSSMRFSFTAKQYPATCSHLLRCCQLARDGQTAVAVWSHAVRVHSRPPAPLPGLFFQALASSSSFPLLLDTFAFLTRSTHRYAFPLTRQVRTSLLDAFLRATASPPAPPPLAFHVHNLEKMRREALLLLDMQPSWPRVKGRVRRTPTIQDREAVEMEDRGQEVGDALSPWEVDALMEWVADVQRHRRKLEAERLHRGEVDSGHQRVAGERAVPSMAAQSLHLPRFPIVPRQVKAGSRGGGGRGA